MVQPQGTRQAILKRILQGIIVTFPIFDEKVVKGDAQDVYCCELDGPAKRTVMFSAAGE
jgi:thiamine phosphate synthase YjbQ (UPF0047 family)